MRLVEQRLTNDCLRAAVATVTGRPYHHVCRINGWETSGEEFWRRWNAWAERNGYRIVAHQGHWRWSYRDAFMQLGMDWSWDPPSSELWIAIVPSLTPERSNHAVVMRGRRLLHDPARSQKRRRVYRRSIRFALSIETA